MNVWKVLGVAGLAGVASAGVIVAREQRQRTQLTPEDIRARLHERLEEVSSHPIAPSPGTTDVSEGRTRRRSWVPRRTIARWPHRKPR